MTKLQLGILSAIIVAGGAACWTIRHSARLKLREKEESSRQQAEWLAQLSAETERLSNLVAQAKSPRSLSADQFLELLRLRGEVGQLRGTRMEADTLRATNQQILATLANSGTNQGHWAGDQVTFAGYADPESALKSTLWSWITGDPGAFLASCPPEERSDLEKAWAGKSEAEIAAQCKILANLYRPANEGVRILGRRTTSPDEAVLDLYFEGDGKTREFVLTRFGDEWKVTGLRSIFN